MQGRNALLLFGTLVLVVVLLNLPNLAALRLKSGVRDTLFPFEEGLSASGSLMARLSAVLLDAWVRPDRERVLEGEVAELREALWQLQAVDRENRELRALLDFARRPGYRLVPCEVIARGDSSGWWQTIRINRGTKSGLAPGMAVMAYDGVIGRTTAVSADTSEVLLITDPLSRVACRIEPSGANGILKGMGVSMMGQAELEMIAVANPGVLEFVAGDAVLHKGDKVFTSGLGGIYPAGLLVGTIEAVDKDRLGLYQIADVVPASTIRRVRYAFVVTQKGGAR